MEPIKQIDLVLEILKKDRGHITVDDLLKRCVANTTSTGVNNGIEGDILSRIVEKLRRDKYVYEVIISGVNIAKYAITFEGYLFSGYEKKLIIENALTSRRNIRDFALTWGTVLAGLAGLGLLGWQIYSNCFLHLK